MSSVVIDVIGQRGWVKWDTVSDKRTNIS